MIGIDRPQIRNVLAAAGLKTVGEVREISDDPLLSFQDLGALYRPSSRNPWRAGVRWRPTIGQKHLMAEHRGRNWKAEGDR